jgi:hypothetical protein
MTKFLDDQFAVRAMHLLIAPTPPAPKDNFDKVVLEIRQLIEKLPGGKLKIRQFAIAHRFLLAKMPLVVTEGFDAKTEYLKMLEFFIENQLRLIEEELAVQEAMWFFEDGEGGLGTPAAGAPTNSTAAVAPQPGEPVIDKKRKRLSAIYKREEPNGELAQTSGLEA